MSRKDLARDVWRVADIMRADDGTSGINDYMEQMSWMIFLKVLEDLENRFSAECDLEGKKYDRIVSTKYSWSSWTKKKWRGEELITFINAELFPTLTTLSGTPEKNTISIIFSEIKQNKMKSASNLKDVIEIIDEIDFNNPEDSHVLSQFYEDLLVKLGKESGIAGEFYTPRPVVKFMVKILNPQLHEDKNIRILDPFCGSCGFLIESYKHIAKSKISAKDYKKLQREVFSGHEKKPLPYLVGIMNCVLHGLLTPNVVRKNSLNENILNFGPEDKFDYVLTNPPFGGVENKQIQQNFPVKSQKTELLALQHVMRRIKLNGKCGIVVPEGLLKSGDSSVDVKRELLQNYNVHTIVSLPMGVFANVTSSGQGPKTNIIFFDKNGPTKKIWYYELSTPRGKNYTKAKPIEESDFDDCYKKWKTKEISANSWVVGVDEILNDNICNLSARNPNKKNDFENLDPIHLVEKITTLQTELGSEFKILQNMVKQTLGNNNN